MSIIIPILGNILVIAISAIALFFIFKLVVLLPISLVRLIAGSKQDKNALASNAADEDCSAQTYIGGYTPSTTYESSAADISESSVPH